MIFKMGLKFQKHYLGIRFYNESNEEGQKEGPLVAGSLKFTGF